MAHPHFNLKDPASDPIQLASNDFLDRFQLGESNEQRDRLARGGSATLAARTYPFGPDELLQIGSDLLMWAFAFDDEYCDEGPLSRNHARFIEACHRIQRAAESPEHAVGEDRYVLGMQDLRRRMDRYASPAHVGRFVEYVRTYMFVESWKAVSPEPDLNDCLVMRQYGGGGWMFLNFAHIIAQVDIQPEEYEDRRVRAMAEIITALYLWDAERYAFTKESARDTRQHNLHAVLQSRHGMSFEESLDYHLTMRNRAISLFRRLHADFLPGASAAQRAYLDSCINYYYGAVEWTRTSSRYASNSGLEEEGNYEGGELVDLVPAETTEPLGIPAFDWWWHYDPARRSADD
ncbi:MULTISPECIES: terpene synthase [unclassified Streptomyces]|uniref:terpene synthase family protein n=1 Tax=unclassified Streptomyces TaxID=2593676 RepID=UPI00116121E4|nr:terpene synthase [Streptomyces sp. TSRI0281]